MEHELVTHKNQVANMEQIFQSQQAQLKQANQELQECKAQQEQVNKLHKDQLDDIHRQLRHANEQLDESATKRNKLDEIHQQLRHAHEQLDEAVTENEKLRDDVLAKTQQVKQYKKQVDGLKTELAKYKSQVGTRSHQHQHKEEVGCTGVWIGQGYTEAYVFLSIINVQGASLFIIDNTLRQIHKQQTVCIGMVSHDL